MRYYGGVLMQSNRLIYRQCYSSSCGGGCTTEEVVTLWPYHLYIIVIRLRGIYYVPQTEVGLYTRSYS